LAKGTSQDEAISNSEEIKPVVPSYAWLKTSVSQLVENLAKYEFLRFHNNLLEGFRVDLKTFLGLTYA